MSDSPVTPVSGYRPQSPETLAQVNENKRTEERLLRLLDSLIVGAPTIDGVDRRWLAIARTHFEEGFMALNRALMRPDRLTGDV